MLDDADHVEGKGRNGHGEEEGTDATESVDEK
jgi:hypothetical protein